MARTESAPWLDLAVSRIGMKEIKGAKHNADILQMFADVGHDEIETDETAWCAVSLGSCLVKTGHTIPPPAVNMMARSYLNYGTKLESPKPGAICVLKRGRPPFGHVGIVESVDTANRTVTLISGNVGNMQKRETRNMSDVLGYRWPIKAGEKPPVAKPVVATAVKSRSAWAQVMAMVTFVVSQLTDWIHVAWEWTIGLVSLLPTLAGEGTQTVESSKVILGWFNIPWSKVGVFTAVAGMSVVLVRHIQDKRRVPWD